MASVMEMVRVLREGGRGLIYAWAKDQEHGKEKSSYLAAEKNGDGESNESVMGERPFGLPVHQNRTNFKHDDMLVPWKLVRETFDFCGVPF